LKASRMRNNAADVPRRDGICNDAYNWASHRILPCMVLPKGTVFPVNSILGIELPAASKR
jgi:hypothetical protein